MPSRKAASRLLDALDKVDQAPAQESPDAALARQLAARERAGWTPPVREQGTLPIEHAALDEHPAPAPAPAPAAAQDALRRNAAPGVPLSVTVPRDLMLRARAAVRAGGYDATLVGLVVEALERELERLEVARGEPFDVNTDVPPLRPGARLR
jgi:hypothetical protein